MLTRVSTDLSTLPELAGFSPDFGVSPGVPVMALFLQPIAVSTPTLQQHFKASPLHYAHAQPLYFDSILLIRVAESNIIMSC